MKREKRRGGFDSSTQQLAGPDSWNALVPSSNDAHLVPHVQQQARAGREVGGEGWGVYLPCLDLWNALVASFDDAHAHFIAHVQQWQERNGGQEVRGRTEGTVHCSCQLALS